MPAEFDTEQAARQARLFTAVCSIPCVVLDRTGQVLDPPDPADNPCRLCRALSRSGLRGQTHLKWIDEAVRFGGQSIYLCENAFTHWTSPIMVDGRVAGALVAGPALMIEDEEFFESELLPRLEVRAADADIGLRSAELRSLFDRVPRLAPQRVTVLAELLSQLARVLGSGGGEALEESALALEQQSRISEYVQDLKRERARAGGDPETPSYPLDKEAELLRHIRAGNLKQAQRTLNELLSHVFFSAGSDMRSVRFRVRELVVLLSRAVLAEGAAPEEVFGLNYQFVEAIDHQEDINGIAYWMARIIRRFVELVLYLPHASHGRALRRAASYLRNNASEPVRVADAARVADMSESHFSRVFHAEMGESVVKFLTRVRMENAAHLLQTTDLPLVEIAGLCGFNDHSYFTRVFRRQFGVTPSRYRETAGWGARSREG